jgi:hypothetical protein
MFCVASAEDNGENLRSQFFALVETERASWTILTRRNIFSKQTRHYSPLAYYRHERVERRPQLSQKFDQHSNHCLERCRFGFPDVKGPHYKSQTRSATSYLEHEVDIPEMFKVKVHNNVSYIEENYIECISVFFSFFRGHPIKANHHIPQVQKSSFFSKLRIQLNECSNFQRRRAINWTFCSRFAHEVLKIPQRNSQTPLGTITYECKQSWIKYRTGFRWEEPEKIR